MSPLSKHVTVRILSAVSTLISGFLVFAISGTSLLQTLLTGISSILGILLAMHLIGKPILSNSLIRCQIVYFHVNKLTINK